MALYRPQVIDTLEQMAAVSDRRFTLDQVKTFVTHLAAVSPAADIAQATGLTEDEVIDLGAKLGTWLTHVEGSVETDIILAAKQPQPPLFQDPAKNAVVIPVGFERRAKQRRDIVRALATIVVHTPDEATLARFLDRLYPSRTSVLAARDVFIVWRFAQVGRLSGLVNISQNPAFCRTMASAFNLLETAVADAEGAIATLVDENADPVNVAAACIKASWVNESRITRLARQAEIAVKDPSTASMLRKSQRSLAMEVKAMPRAWSFTDIAQLLEGQVLRIVQAAGLVNEESARREALDIRAKLMELDEANGSDLSKDLDLLVPEGLRAKRAGLEITFWEAIDARIAGDPLWRDLLESAFVSA
jgi:hypothetical protein